MPPTVEKKGILMYTGLTDAKRTPFCHLSGEWIHLTYVLEALLPNIGHKHNANVALHLALYCLLQSITKTESLGWL